VRKCRIQKRVSKEKERPWEVLAYGRPTIGQKKLTNKTDGKPGESLEHKLSGPEGYHDVLLEAIDVA